ncbi:beta strand repeat-containing protein, partial [Methylobacterium trifolii]
GGRIRVGGDVQGGGTLQRAATTRVDAATRISADAGNAGDGGSIVVWSDRMTDFAGRISARGGTTGGNGGNAEVSGRSLLAYTGSSDLTAARGSFGTLLLDPYNVVISNGASSNQTGFAATGNDSVINATTLSNALGTANVTVTTGGAGSPGAQAGDITVAAPVSWSAPTTLTLQAYHSIVVNSDLRVNGAGGLVFTTNNGGTGGTLSFGNGATATYATSNGAGIAGQSLVIDGQAYRLLYTTADLQSMSGNLDGAFALARGIDAGGTAFTPVGGTDAAFTGRFNGLGQTIANLTINTPARDSSGLFGAATGATIGNVALGALALTGGDNTGGLVGFATNTTVGGVTVAGRVTGANTTGGLLGAQINGSVANASTSATVTGTDNTGGLVGVMDGGTITRSFTTGQVGGGSFVGGLVGIAQSAAISLSYATGGVTGTDPVGGLVGGLGGEGTSQAPGTIASSYATGAVTGQGRSGGLVGILSNGGLIRDSYATGLTSGGTASGGLIGEINSIPADGGSTANAVVTTSYATGLLTGAGTRGGLVGNVDGTLQTITNAYWDTQTTGVATSAGTGATGLTTAQLQGTLPAGFVAGTWGTQASAYPYLTWRFPTGVLAVSGFTRGAADPGSPLAGEPVRVATGGTASYQTNSGANGYYYVARDPLTGPAPQGVTAFLDGANRGASITDAPLGAGAVTNLDPRIGRVLVTTVQTTASGLATELANAGDGTVSANIPYTVAGAGGVPTFGSGLPTFIAALAGGGFTVDRSIVSAGSLQIAGAISPAGTASAGPLGISAGQSVRSLNGDVVIATTQFTNNAGATAVQAGGRFLIYSQDYAADQRGGLAGGNLYNRSFLGNGPATVTQAGSQFIYTRQPVLTVTAANATREYGPTTLGFTPGVTGLVNGDTAAQAFAGTPGVTDTTLPTTGVGTYAGAAQVTPGTLTSTIGYAVSFVNGPVTITPAPLVIRANDATRPFGTPIFFAGTEFTATGLRNTDQVSRVTLTSDGAPALAPVIGSPYPIVASNAQGDGLQNYAVTYQPGSLTVTGSPIDPLTIALTTPTLDRQFPTTFVPVVDPPDVILVAGTEETDIGSPTGVVGPGSGIGSSGGPTLGTGRAVPV